MLWGFRRRSRAEDRDPSPNALPKCSLKASWEAKGTGVHGHGHHPEVVLGHCMRRAPAVQPGSGRPALAPLWSRRPAEPDWGLGDAPEWSPPHPTQQLPGLSQGLECPTQIRGACSSPADLGAALGDQAHAVQHPHHVDDSGGDPGLIATRWRPGVEPGTPLSVAGFLCSELAPGFGGGRTAERAE